MQYKNYIIMKGDDVIIALILHMSCVHDCPPEQSGHSLVNSNQVATMS